MKTLILFLMLTSQALADASDIRLQLTIFQKMGECANYIRSDIGNGESCETMKFLMNSSPKDVDSMTEALKGLSHEARVEVLNNALFLQRTFGKKL